MTSIATWNLHHMGREARIPPEVVAVIERVRPDVLVLTEYVDRGKRAHFRAELDGIGYRQPKCSGRGREPRQNQVLIASRVEQVAGTLPPPNVDEAAATNFLHQCFSSLDLEVVGFRVPHYQSEKPVQPENLVKYWREFTEMALGLAGHKVVFIGDFNVGIKNVDVPGQKALRKVVKDGYRMCAEEGALDRALVSPKLRLRSFSVIEASGEHRLTGKGGLSDHPMLVVEVE